MDEPARSAPEPPKRSSRGRGRPTDQTGDDTRVAILAVAQRMFGQHGFTGVSMDAIAGETGVNARAIYYHFGSKRLLFEAATSVAFERFAQEVVGQVFRHRSLRRRIDGYIDVYRSLHASDPDLLAFIGVVLLDALSNEAEAATAAAGLVTGAALTQFLETLVDEAFANGEVHPDLDREGALMLLQAMGMGLALLSLNSSGSFPAMLDAFDLLNAGTIFTKPIETE